jgi:methionyl-tRNA formyltransferase
MKKMSEPIVFFGSGPVAAESLRQLAADFTIEAVITKPRPQHHRGDVPVLSVAEKKGLEVKTVADRDTLDALFERTKFRSRLAILIDFGIIISKKVIDYFPFGIVNSHFSLLPEWRGADPITFAILSGQKQTGVSLMLLVEAMDEGPLLAQAPFPLSRHITTPELTNALVEISYHMLVAVIPSYALGDVLAQPQDTSLPISYSRKLTKNDGIIDWNKSAVQLEREIRAFLDWPKSRTALGGMDVIITQAHVIDKSGAAGAIETSKGDLTVYCGQQALVIDHLKPAGKSGMSGSAFLAGYKKRLHLQ